MGNHVVQREFRRLEVALKVMGPEQVEAGALHDTEDPDKCRRGVKGTAYCVLCTSSVAEASGLPCGLLVAVSAGAST